MKKLTEDNIRLLTYCVLTVVVCWFLLVYCKYDYLHAEQFRMFRYSWDYAAPLLTSVNGAFTLLADFITQFYINPVWAALLNAVIFLFMTLAVDGILKKILPGYLLPFFALLAGLETVIYLTRIDCNMEGVLMLLAGLGICCLLLHFWKGKIILPSPKKQKLRLGIGGVLVLCAFWTGLQLFVKQHPAQSTRLKVQEVMRWQEDWDGILSLPYMKTMPNVLYAAYQNLALAEKGMLGEDWSKYPQVGENGLWYVTTGQQFEYMLLSDIYYIQGNVAQAQMMAFNGLYYSSRMATPHLLERLIETNLIYGADKVAEKYISLLEETLFYKDKAASYRQFLGHAEKLKADARLGKLKEITDKLDGYDSGIVHDLEAIHAACPDYKPAADYLNAYHQLSEK